MASINSPEAAQAIRELSTVYNSMRSAIQSALNVLKANGLAPDDPIAVVAKLGTNERNGEGA